MNGVLSKGPLLPNKGLVAVAATLLALIAFLGNARADAPPLDLGNEVRVESAYASSGAEGESTKIRFRLVNESGVSLVLLRASSSIAENARLVGRIGASETTELESITVPAEETLDLTTTHLWYELSPLRESLKPGDVFELSLDFVNARVSVDVHVH